MPNKPPLSVTPKNPWVKGIYPGTHTAMNGQAVTFTAADVSSHVALVKKQLEPGYMPPLVTGHPKHDDPRVGSMVDVEERDDGAAWYKVDHLTPAFAESCKKGEYLYTSPMLNRDGSIRHLGALGAWNPSLKDQPAIAFGEMAFGAPEGGADEGLAFGVSGDWGTVTGNWLNRLVWRLQAIGTILQRQRDGVIEKDGVEAADKILPQHEIDNLKNLEVPYNIDPAAPDAASPAFGEGGDPPAPVVVPPEPPAPASPVPPTAPAVPTPRELELEAQLQAANRELANRQHAEAVAAFGAHLDKAAGEGRLSPVVRTELENLHTEFLAFSAGNGLAFGEADPIPKTLIQIIDVLPKLVAFGELDLDVRLPHPPKPENPMMADAERRAQAAKEFQ